MPGIFQSMLVIFSVASLLTAVAVQLFYLGARCCFTYLSPVRRARLLFLLGSAPLAVPLLLLMLVFIPSILTWAGLVPDHCLAHDDHHGHLCFIHPPAFIRNPWVTVIALLLVAIVVLRWIRGFAEAYQARTWSRLFQRNSHRAPGRCYRLVDVDRVLACSIGMFRPEILISRGLEDRLSTEELQVVIAHERAHVERRDALKLFIVKMLGVFFLPQVSKALLSDLALAGEQVCDQQASRETGSSIRVAKTIVKVQKLLPEQSEDPLPAVHFSHVHIVQRVTSLLDQRSRGRFYHGMLPKYLLPGATMLFLLVYYEPIHHYVEDLYFALFQ